MGIDIIAHIFAKPLGFIGVVLALVGIYLILTGNLLGILGLIVGVILGYVSEKR